MISLCCRIPSTALHLGLLLLGWRICCQVGTSFCPMPSACQLSRECIGEKPPTLLFPPSYRLNKLHLLSGFPGGIVVKNLPANTGDARDMDLIPGSGRSPGGGHGSPLQYSCLVAAMDGGTQRGYSPWGCSLELA